MLFLVIAKFLMVICRTSVLFFNRFGQKFGKNRNQTFSSQEYFNVPNSSKPKSFGEKVTAILTLPYMEIGNRTFNHTGPTLQNHKFGFRHHSFELLATKPVFGSHLAADILYYEINSLGSSTAPCKVRTLHFVPPLFPISSSSDVLSSSCESPPRDDRFATNVFVLKSATYLVILSLWPKSTKYTDYTLFFIAGYV